MLSLLDLSKTKLESLVWLAGHLRIVDAMARNHKCTVCGKAFVSKKELDAHAKKPHIATLKRKGLMDWGNVRAEKAKKVSQELFKRYQDEFTADFEENKVLIASLASARGRSSKRVRNTIAGYITRLAVLSQSRRTEKQRRYQQEACVSLQ